MSYETDNSGRIKYTPDLHENQRKGWTPSEINYVIANFYVTGSEEISLALGRTEGAVEDMASKMRKAGRLIRPKGFTQTRKQIKRRYAA